MRFADGYQAIPEILLAIVVVAVFGGGVTVLILVLGFAGWESLYARRLQPDALAARAAVRRGGGRLGGGRPLRHVAAHPAADVAGADGDRHPAGRPADPAGDGAQLPGPRPAAADGDLGQHPGRGPRPPAGGAVDRQSRRHAPSCCWCWASTCWATACAKRSIRGARTGDEKEKERKCVETPIPAYYRIYQVLSERIATGVYRLGYAASDRQRDHGRVRRQPSHRALGRRGAGVAQLVQRFPGRGTFVLESDPDSPRLERARARRPARSTIPTRASSCTASSTCRRMADERVAALLQVPPSEGILRISWSRVRPDGPVAFCAAHLPQDLAERAAVRHGRADAFGARHPADREVLRRAGLPRAAGLLGGRRRRASWQRACRSSRARRCCCCSAPTSISKARRSTTRTSTSGPTASSTRSSFSATTSRSNWRVQCLPVRRRRPPERTARSES